MDFINGSTCYETRLLFRPYEEYFESCLDDINRKIFDFRISEEKYMLESSIMGESNDRIFYEAEKKSVFEKIGQAVMSIFKTFAELMDKIIDKVKSIGMKNKTDIQKLEILIKKNPSLKDEAIAAFDKGYLELGDIRSLKELDAAFDEILKMTKNKETDPKTIKAKWEKAKANFEKDEKSWKVVKVATATTAVLSAALAIKTFKPKCLKAEQDAQDSKKAMSERKAAIYKALQEENVINDDTGKWQATLTIWRELNSKHAAARKENLTRLEKVANAIASFLDKHSSQNSQDRFKADVGHTLKNIADAKEGEKKKLHDETYEITLARKEAERKDRADSC